MKLIIFLLASAAKGSWQPHQVALAAGGRADEVSITWITEDPREDLDSCAQVAVVTLYRTASNVAGKGDVRTGTCLRYSFGSAPHMHGNYTSGRIHRVHVNGLAANSEYRYTLHGDPPDIMRSFKTLPASKMPGSQDERYPFVFGVIGDLGQTLQSTETVRHLDADKDIQLILHAGDTSYSDADSVRWDNYGLMVEPLSSRLQWMVCPGDHEIESDYYTGQNFQAYEARFAMPAVRKAEFSPSMQQIGCIHPFPWRPHTGPNCIPSAFTAHYDWGNSFYAFDAGPARVISLNSFADTGPSSAQYKWLKEELEILENRGRANTPWLVVMMHCPFYNSNEAHQEEVQTTRMRDDHGFEDLFHQYKVAVVISGHVHAYERSHPVFKNVSQQGAPVYIVVGDGGNREGHASTYQKDQPNWSAFRDGLSFGHGRLVIANATHMRWEWYRNDEQQPATTLVRRTEQAASAVVSTPRNAYWMMLWNRPLPARTMEDDVWIFNPYKAQDDQDGQVQHAQPPAGPAASEHLLIGAISAFLVAGVLVHRYRRPRQRRGEARSVEIGQLSSQFLEQEATLECSGNDPLL